MANYEINVHLTLTDVNGDTATMVIPQGVLTDTNTVAQLVTDTNAAITALGAPGTITNAKVTSASIYILVEKANPSGAVDAQYSRVRDKAILNFLNSSGEKGVLSIPAPVAAVFGTAPLEDVVDASGPVSTLITYYTANAAHSHLLNVYNGGRKGGGKSSRRAQHKVG